MMTYFDVLTKLSLLQVCFETESYFESSFLIKLIESATNQVRESKVLTNAHIWKMFGALDLPRPKEICHSRQICVDVHIICFCIVNSYQLNSSTRFRSILKSRPLRRILYQCIPHTSIPGERQIFIQVLLLWMSFRRIRKVLT